MLKIQTISLPGVSAQKNWHLDHWPRIPQIIRVCLQTAPLCFFLPLRQCSVIMIYISTFTECIVFTFTSFIQATVFCFFMLSQTPSSVFRAIASADRESQHTDCSHSVSNQQHCCIDVEESLFLLFVCIPFGNFPGFKPCILS